VRLPLVAALALVLPVSAAAAPITLQYEVTITSASSTYYPSGSLGRNRPSPYEAIVFTAPFSFLLEMTADPDVQGGPVTFSPTPLVFPYESLQPIPTDARFGSFSTFSDGGFSAFNSYGGYFGPPISPFEQVTVPDTPWMQMHLGESADGSMLFSQHVFVGFYAAGWRVRHDTGYSGTATRVPEPATSLLLIAAVATLWNQRERWRRNPQQR
jgi:hypothetical protein